MRLLAWVSLLLALSSAFDFDDDEADATLPAGDAFAGAAEGIAVPLSARIGKGEFKPRARLFYRDVRQVTGVKVSGRLTQSKLSGEDLDTFKELLKTGGYYTLQMPSVIGDDASPPVSASISVCSLMASRFQEHLHLTLASSKRIVALTYTVPVVTQRCPTTGLPRIALDEVLFNTTLTLSLPTEGPRPEGKVADAGFIPPSAAAAAARSQESKNGEGEEPPPPQSFLKRYWMYILPLVLMLTFGGGPDPKDEKQGEEGGKGGAVAATSASGGGGGRSQGNSKRK